MTIQTDIGDIKPHIKPGWVAMDKNCRWCWYKHKPHINESKGMWLRDEIEHQWCDLGCLDIEPVSDWTKSLIKVSGE